VNDLLEYSRVGRVGTNFSKVDANKVLQETLENLTSSIEETHAKITHDPLPEFTGDALQLQQLFQNLIGNALKFRDSKEPEIHIGVRREPKEWLFWVRDNGIGIEPQYKDRIFLIFQRLHDRHQYSGTGIGLAICKKIVEWHGGRIWVESQLGQGSTFFFTIPFNRPG
jgi:two-component system, chemotaxis family, sensor kinase Cph1